MVRGSGVLGALVGAGGATAYYNGVDVSGTMRYLLTGGQLRDLPSWQSSGGNGRELDALYKLVEQLSRDVHRQQGVTISMASNRGNGVVLLYTVGAAGAGYVYLRVFKGWRLSDLMYVTRSSLTKSMNTVTAGVDSLSQRLSSMRTFVQQQVASLTKKQDDTLAAQAALEKQVSAVGEDVEDTRSKVDEVHSSVRVLEGSMEQLREQQMSANTGIYLLCRVVGDLMKSAGHRMGSVKELDTYIRNPHAIAGHVQGLEGLLQQVEQDGPDEARFEGLPALSGAPSAPSGGRRGKPLGSAADWVKMSRAPTA
ncbi:hypothetical protein COCOBI_17-3390 [Coccomyxa sp. Obi]|nr:hypothetical protein COCOBI_17-3390 [Coccomyxa sp. Obi]